MDLDGPDAVVAVHGGAVVRAADRARGKCAVVVAAGDLRALGL